MESLETLNLFECTSLQEFPEICGDMRRLSILDLGSPWIRSLPLSLSGLRELRLAYCEILESIPETIRNLSDLCISGCNKLATLPNSLFESQQLECLNIEQCSGLVKLPILLGVQKKLYWLKIDRCENLKKLPSSIQMESLEQLEISNCPKLDTFPEIKGDMHCLTRLTLNSTGIREVPSSIGNLSRLTYINLSSTRIREVPSSIGNLSGLTSLNLNSTGIREVPSSIGNLSGLTYINLTDCEDLVSLPDCLCNSMNLQRLILSGCKRLEKLPGNIGDLHQNLNGLPGKLPPNLRELFADYHLALKSIRDLVIYYPKLCRLAISACETVSSEQVNVFLQHFLIQCDFHQRDYFLIYFSGVRIPELFDYDQFINEKKISIDLNPSWYTDKFMGFLICYGPTSRLDAIFEATLVCKSDPERKYSLKYNIPLYLSYNDPFICCAYIPFGTLWNRSGNREGKNPNDYYMLEVSYMWSKEKELCWGIRLEYEKEAIGDIGHPKKKRKQ